MGPLLKLSSWVMFFLPRSYGYATWDLSFSLRHFFPQHKCFHCNSLSINCRQLLIRYSLFCPWILSFLPTSAETFLPCYMIYVSCHSLYCKGAYSRILSLFLLMHFFQFQAEGTFCFISYVTESSMYERNGGIASFYYIYYINEKRGKQFKIESLKLEERS